MHSLPKITLHPFNIYSGDLKSGHLKSGNIWNPDPFVRISNVFWQKGGGYFRSHMKSRLFANQPFFDHLKSRLVRVSDPQSNVQTSLYWLNERRIDEVQTETAGESKDRDSLFFIAVKQSLELLLRHLPPNSALNCVLNMFCYSNCFRKILRNGEC